MSEPAIYFVVWMPETPLCREWYGRHDWQSIVSVFATDRDPHPNDAITKADIERRAEIEPGIRDDPRYRIVTYDELVAIIASTRAQHALTGQSE